MKRKGKYPDEIQILTCDAKRNVGFKRNLTDGNLIRNVV